MQKIEKLESKQVNKVSKDLYRVCHRFRLTKQDDYFWVIFGHSWSKRHFLRQVWQCQKIGLSRKLNHQNKVKLVLIYETLCWID